ncbi:MAG: hypothetical protein J7513_00200 [Solirubrobacteraceae bacterium]|nr:hypothetical protein [Solirubrobacteraceae bacterium]
MTAPTEPTNAPVEEPDAPSGRALPFAIAGVAVLVAIVLFAVFSRENESNPVDDASAALQASAATLAGPLNVTGLQHAKCVRGDGSGMYRCTPVMNNAESTGGVTVHYSGGVVTKQLAGSSLTAAPRAGSEVATLLDADEKATLGRTVKYGCAFTIGINPDGSQASGSPGGFRCATAKPPAGEDAVLQRYVEFADDGMVTRDFMLAG